jgi:hypothetical protein
MHSGLNQSKMGESLEKELKNGCCWQKMKEAAEK